MTDFFGLEPEKAQLLVAGALGGLVRWLTLKDNWKDGLISVAVGGLCAAYISPLAVPALTPFLGNVGITTDSVVGLSGFLTGIGGITASAFIIDVWRARRKMLKTAANKGDQK